LTRDVDEATFLHLLEETVTNGLKTFFVLMVLALGVAAPMLLTRRESAKHIKIQTIVRGKRR
jgi:hypothetical protein